MAYYKRICRECSREFSGGPRAWYCPMCRAERNKARDRAIKREGSRRKLGDIDICVKCGAEYIVRGGLQKYCDDCAPIEIAKIDAQQGMEYYLANAEIINAKKREKRKKSRPPD